MVPLWSHDGRDLFFGPDGRQILAVTMQARTTLVAGRPHVLFELAMLLQSFGNQRYDISPDGRFLIIGSGETDVHGGPASNLIVVQNWTEELKRWGPTH